MSRNFEMAVRWDLAGLPHLVQHPEAALVIYEKTAAAQPCRPLHIFNRPHDLFLAAQAVSHAHTFLRMHRSRRIRCGTGPYRQNQICLPGMCQFHHLGYFLVGETHDSLGLGDAMKIKSIGIHGLQKRLHHLGALNARHLKAVLAAVFKTFF